MMRRLRERLARWLAPELIVALEAQVDGLLQQVRHAAKATNEMAARSRRAEVALHAERLRKQGVPGLPFFH